MLQGLYSPTMEQGIIASKGFLDYDLIRTFQENAENPSIASCCYPGGGNEENHGAMQGDLSFGRKDTANSDMANGESNEQGVVAVAGLHWGAYCSQREMEDDFYFQGVVTSESRLINPLESNTGDPEHGYSMAMAGTKSIINNGPMPFYPRTHVAWRIPPAPFHPRADGDLFNGGSSINKTARYGTPPTQFRFEVVPFDYSDFSVPFSAAFAAMSNPKSMNGIKDIPLAHSLPNTSHYQARKYSCIQDDALSFRNGLSAVALVFINRLSKAGVLPEGIDAAVIGERLGLFAKGEPTEEQHNLLMACMADLFLTNINNGDSLRTEAQTRFQNETGVSVVDAATTNPETPAQGWARLRVHGLDMLVQGIAGSWYSKTSKIIGVSMNSAATADTLDVTLGHFAL